MTRVCVVGGGALGSAAAWALARRRASVTLVERYEAGHAKGGSHGSTRIFRLAYDVPDYVRLAQAALPLWRELEEESETPLLEIGGGVDHGDQATLAAIRDALSACGAPFSMLDGAEATRRWPGMRFDGHVLHQAQGGRVDASATVAALQRVAAERGAALHFGDLALWIRASASEVIVQTPSATHVADVCVVACGGATAGLAGHLVPLQPTLVTEQHPAHFRPHDLDAAWPSFIHHRPPGPAIYGAGAPEGVKLGEHGGGGRRVDPDTRPDGPDEAALERLSAYVREWLPGLDSRVVSYSPCLYDSTPSEDFVIDRSGPLVVAAGTSGHGFKFVPVLGEMIAALALGEEQRIERFRLPERRLAGR